MATKRNVVIAIDNSQHSEFAFDFYVKYILKDNDNIVFVHVSEYTSISQAPVLLTDPVVVMELIREEQDLTRALVGKYEAKMKALGLHIPGKVKQVPGKSGEAIVTAAKEENADLIVLGTRGVGKLRRTLLGSVSSYVLHHSDVPVMIARHPHNS